MRSKKYFFSQILLILAFFVQCKIDRIEQPVHAAPGEIIDIKVYISDAIDETNNPHKGVLCVLVPSDWEFLSGEYESRVGSGVMSFSSEWSDSAEKCYPSYEFAKNMHWVALISDTGYTYTNNPSVEIFTRWQVGQQQGCFSLAYLATKATRDLICTNWSPFSYPHPIGIAAYCDTTKTPKAEPAPEWTELFHRHSGWTGSDAVYSIPISGYDSPDPGRSDKTIFFFGDTFIGEVNENDVRVNSRMIRNTMALLNGKRPVADSIKFYWFKTQNGDPAALFEADTPGSQPGDWIWPMDGIALNGKIFVFGLRLETADQYFRINGTTRISFELDSTDQIVNYSHIDAPLFCKTGSGEIVIGQAVMPLTENSGAMYPDGYIYVYGPRSSFGQKGLVAARVYEQDFEDFSRWEFWDGSEWQQDIAACAIITNGISQEFSVTPMPDGRFILVFEAGGKVKIKFGSSPVGPFQAAISVYDCPEPTSGFNIFVYNAKAHPHLSSPDELLISYNVNTTSLYNLIHHADIYRPRFIKLKLFGEASGVNLRKRSHLPTEFDVLENFPNPFNGATTITFTLKRESIVSLEVLNVLGERVKTLLQAVPRSSGRFVLHWDGKDDKGNLLASGVYLCKIQLNEKIYARKMVLLR